MVYNGDHFFPPYRKTSGVRCRVESWRRKYDEFSRCRAGMWSHSTSRALVRDRWFLRSFRSESCRSRYPLTSGSSCHLSDRVGVSKWRSETGTTFLGASPRVRRSSFRSLSPLTRSSASVRARWTRRRSPWRDAGASRKVLFDPNDWKLEPLRGSVRWHRSSKLALNSFRFRLLHSRPSLLREPLLIPKERLHPKSQQEPLEPHLSPSSRSVTLRTSTRSHGSAQSSLLQTTETALLVSRSPSVVVDCYWTPCESDSKRTRSSRRSDLPLFVFRMFRTYVSVVIGQNVKEIRMYSFTFIFKD